MKLDGVFSGTIPILEKVLDLRSQRHGLIVSNITNADTPNYKAFDMMVEEAMQKERAGESGFALERTHADHMPSSPRARDPRIRAVKSEEMLVRRSDNNTVDIDREMANLSENGLLYSASAQILAKKFEMLASAIKGGGSQ
jgi:flagellar basal-body rod protein FlgB